MILTKNKEKFPCIEQDFYDEVAVDVCKSKTAECTEYEHRQLFPDPLCVLCGKFFVSIHEVV
jgi:hypothetical protein